MDVIDQPRTSLPVRASIHTYFYALLIFDHFCCLVPSTFYSGSPGPKKPLSSLASVVSWFIQLMHSPVSTYTGAATQESKNSLPNFHEFVKHLSGIAVQNNKHITAITIQFSSLDSASSEPSQQSCLILIEDFLVHSILILLHLRLYK